MTTWAPCDHRDKREEGDALLTSDPAGQQFTQKHYDRRSGRLTVSSLREHEDFETISRSSWTHMGESPTRTRLLAATGSPSRESRSRNSPSRHASRKGESMNGEHHRHGHSPSRRQSGHQAPNVVARDSAGLAGELAAEAKQQELNLHKHHHHVNVLSLGEIGKREARHVE